MIVLLYLYFIGLMTSISVMDAISSLILLHWLYLLISKKIKLFPLGLSKFYMPWIAVILLSLVANQPNVHWAAALADMKWMLLIPLVAWSAAAANFKDKLVLKNLRYFYIPILFTSAYAVLITVLGFDPIRPNRTDLLLISGIGGVRTPGFLGNSMTFAQAYGVLFCMLWAYCLYFFNELKLQISKVDFYALILTLTLTTMAIFLTFTRGVWLSVGISLLVVSFMYKPKIGMWVALSAVVFLLLAVVFVPTIRARLSEVVMVTSSQSDRWHLWQANFKMFLDHPFTGVGYGENFYRLDEYFMKMGLPQNSFKSHAHNQFLQQLGGTGIFGLLIYLGFLFNLAKQALFYWRSPQVTDYLHKALGLGVYAVILHIFLGGLFEANFIDSETLQMFCFFVGLLLYFKNLKPKT